MRKTPEDFYNLYNQEFRRRFFREIFPGGIDNGDLHDEALAYLFFLVFFLRAWEQTRNQDCYSFKSFSFSDFLDSLSDEETERLFEATRAKIQANSDLVVFFEIWFREMLSSRCNLPDLRLDEIFKELRKKKKMKKYLTEKTVALGLAALFACGVALGASLSSDERGDASPIAKTNVPATAVCPCESCDCVDCPDKATKTARSRGCETTSQNK